MISKFHVGIGLDARTGPVGGSHVRPLVGRRPLLNVALNCVLFAFGLRRGLYSRGGVLFFSSSHGSRGYGFSSACAQGSMSVRRFFFGKAMNRRGYRLGRLLVASHPEWRASL